MNDAHKPVSVLILPEGCDFSDIDKVYTLADADRLTRSLTLTYRDRILSALLTRFHKAPDFIIEYTCRFTEGDSSFNGPIDRLALSFTGLDAEHSAVATETLCSILGVDSIKADTRASMRTLLEAIAREVPQIREYFDF